MNIDKNMILQLLQSQGNHAQAAQADQTLPDQVDTDHPDHQNMLSGLGINPTELIGQLGGLGGLSKLL